MSKQTSSFRPETAITNLTPAPSGILQRKCACGNHTIAGGECAECAKDKNNLQRKADSQNALGAGPSLSHGSVLQAKLTIGASDDPLEQEADRVADQVLAAPAHPAVSGAPPHIQRFAWRPAGPTRTAPASVDRVLASPGSPLGPALRQDMEQRFGHDFSIVRVHSGEAGEQSARDVNAHAYTVGHNIVFGAGQFAPGTHHGRRLIAHELTHAIQQSDGAKSIQRAPAAGIDLSLLADDRPVRNVERMPTIPDPHFRYVVQAPEKRYDFSVNVHTKPMEFRNLTPPQVIEKLRAVWRLCQDDIDDGRAWNEHLVKRRESQWVVGFWADRFGRADLPDPDMWNEVGRGPLSDARQALDATDAALKTHWQAIEASLDRNLAPGLESNPYIQAALAFDPTEQRIREAVALLQKAAAQLRERQRIVDAYVSGSNRGAERAIAGIQVTIVVLSAAATGGGASFAGKGAGLLAQSGAAALTAGGVGAATETFNQIGEMRVGDRQAWDFDLKRIAKRGVMDTVQGFIGGVVAGKFSQVLKGRIGGWVGGLSDETLAAYGITKEELLTNGEKMFIDWVAGVGSSPVTAASGQLMHRAIEGEWQVKSFDDFAGLMFDDMVKMGTLSLFLEFGGKAIAGGKARSVGGTKTSESSPAATPSKAGPNTASESGAPKLSTLSPKVETHVPGGPKPANDPAVKAAPRTAPVAKVEPEPILKPKVEPEAQRGQAPFIEPAPVTPEETKPVSAKMSSDPKTSSIVKDAAYRQRKEQMRQQAREDREVEKGVGDTEQHAAQGKSREESRREEREQLATSPRKLPADAAREAMAAYRDIRSRRPTYLHDAVKRKLTERFERLMEQAGWSAQRRNPLKANFDEALRTPRNAAAQQEFLAGGPRVPGMGKKGTKRPDYDQRRATAEGSRERTHYDLKSHNINDMREADLVNLARKLTGEAFAKTHALPEGEEVVIRYGTRPRDEFGVSPRLEETMNAEHFRPNSPISEVHYGTVVYRNPNPATARP